MTFVSRLGSEQWAEARALRAQGESFAAIGRRLGIGSSGVSDRARREGWASNPPAAAGNRPHARAAGSPAMASARRLLVRRLYKVIDLRIKMMELRMSKQLEALEQGQEPPPANDDREGIGALIKNIEQVMELDSDADPTAGGGPRSKSTTAQSRASEADARRREIADHLERLLPPS